MIREFYGKKPIVHPDAFIAETAVLIGDVEIGKDSSVWYGAVLRGDINSIKIGERTNIQDNCVIHIDIDKPTVIGDDVTVGHGAILHGCTIGNAVLIGMGAVVLDGAQIGDGCVIAAGAVVKERANIPPRTLVAGIPAKPKRELDPSIPQMLIEHSAKYAEYAKSFKKAGGT